MTYTRHNPDCHRGLLHIAGETYVEEELMGRGKEGMHRVGLYIHDGNGSVGVHVSWGGAYFS